MSEKQPKSAQKRPNVLDILNVKTGVPALMHALREKKALGAERYKAKEDPTAKRIRGDIHTAILCTVSHGVLIACVLGLTGIGIAKVYEEHEQNGNGQYTMPLRKEIQVDHNKSTPHTPSSALSPEDLFLRGRINVWSYWKRVIESSNFFSPIGDQGQNKHIQLEILSELFLDNIPRNFTKDPKIEQKLAKMEVLIEGSTPRETFFQKLAIPFYDIDSKQLSLPEPTLPLFEDFPQFDLMIALNDWHEHSPGKGEERLISPKMKLLVEHYTRHFESMDSALSEIILHSKPEDQSRLMELITEAAKDDIEKLIKELGPLSEERKEIEIVRHSYRYLRWFLLRYGTELKEPSRKTLIAFADAPEQHFVLPKKKYILPKIDFKKPNE